MVVVVGGGGVSEVAGEAREISIEKVIAGAYANHLAPGEIFTRVVIPSAKSSHRAAYMKFQIHERPTLGLGLWLDASDGGRTFAAARVAVGCACPFPSRPPAADQLYHGPRPEDAGPPHHAAPPHPD